MIHHQFIPLALCQGFIISAIPLKREAEHKARLELNLEKNNNAFVCPQKK